MAADAHDRRDEAETSREDRRERYRSVLRTVRHNAGHPQPPMPRRSSIATTAVAHGLLSSDEFETARDAALANGDLLTWTDGDNVERLALTASGFDEIGVAPDRVFGVDDEPALRQIVATETSRVPPDKEIVGWANSRLLEIEENNPMDPTDE